jgi:molecular chaperone GrpE
MPNKENENIEVESKAEETKKDAASEIANENEEALIVEPEQEITEKDDTENNTEKAGDAGNQDEALKNGGKDGKPEGKEKKIFGRKKEKKDKKDEKIEELTDRLTRQLAEFDNYRKRTEKEKAANYIIGAKDVIEKILPVVDNFERGLANADLSDPFADGMNKVYKQFIQLLSELGVTPIEAVGKPFDPAYHNAVMQVQDENYEPNTVVEEFQKGYMYKDQVVRFSMVKVSG